MTLGERKRVILKAVVDDYIRSAEPVGSKSLTSQLDLKVSSATIRNEMAELETLGYLEQPHTSAGRIPSNRGYRLYVDELMNQHKLTEKEMDSINKSLQLRIREFDMLISEAGRLISSLTNYAAFTTVSHVSEVVIRRIDLIPVDKESFVIILLFSTNLIKNTIAKKQPGVTDEKLYVIAAVLNAKLVNCNSYQMCHIAATEIASAIDVPESFVQMLLDYIKEVVTHMNDGRVFINGAEHMLEQPEYQNVMKAHKVLEYLSNRNSIAKMLKPEENMVIKIIIGPENVNNELYESSVVMASYEIEDGLRGLIGVVGPTRMDYSRVAANLGYFTRRLNKLLDRDTAQSE